MIVGAVIRKGLIPAAAVISEVKMQNPDQKHENAFVCRPSELPIYTPDPPSFTKQGGIQQEELPSPSFIQNSVKTVRHTITKYKEEYEAYEKVAKQSLSDGKQNVEWLVDYLRQEDNTLPKAGAIGIGALTGLIFGLRGGFFKRTIYATTGALAMSAVCYPKEASEYSQFVAVEGKKILTIAYNFAYGVKKDDPPLELPTLPKLPTSVSGVWDSVKSTASSFISDESDKLEEVSNINKVNIELEPYPYPPEDESSQDNSYCPASNEQQIPGP